MNILSIQSSVAYGHVGNIAAAYEFFERYNRCPWRVLSIIGSDPAEIA